MELSGKLTGKYDKFKVQHCRPFDTTSYQKSFILSAKVQQVFSAEAANNDTLHSRFFFVIFFDIKSKAIRTIVSVQQCWKIKYFCLAGCRQ